MNLIDRECDGCGRSFRALKTSPQRFCGRECEFGTAAPGERRKQWWQSANKTKPAPAKGTAPQASAKANPKETKSVTPKTKKTNEPAPRGTTSATNKPSTLSASQEPNEIDDANENSSGDTMRKTESDISNKNVPAVMSETQTGSLERYESFMKEETLNSMTLLKRSGNRLLMLMEESVSDSDFDKSRQGAQRIDHSKMFQAIQCADALARTVSTQIQMAKFLTEVGGKK